MLKKAGQLHIAGRVFDVYVDPKLGERPGESDGIHGHDGESNWEEGTLHISQVDDSTLAHETGHIVSRARGVYMSEYQVQTFEELFTVCRDPRNFWLLEYFAGCKLKRMP